MSNPPDRLDSWKEIAAHLNRSVRTVRRWEREEGLPVHRQIHHKLGSVYASRSEIDRWRESHSRAPEAPPQEAAKSIAVLPFENLSTDPDNEYFVEGLADEVTTNLSKIRALRVISRTSARTVRNTTKDAKAIGAQLGVRYLVEGSVRRTGNRLRLNAQLIDAVTDGHLWGDTYEGTVEDVFAMQERLARQIVDALHLRLTADEQHRLGERDIDSVPAYECYLRARHEGWRWREDSIDRAVHLLRGALTIIGENPRLYAALGLAWLQYREAGIDLSERPLAEAEKCVTRVFALDPQSSSGFQLRGWLHYSRHDIQSAVDDLKAALEADPNDADSMLLLSNCYLISGRVAEARPLIARLLQIDPLTPVTRCMPAFAGIMEGNFESAIGPYRQMLELDPSNPMARLFYVWVLSLNRRTEEAREIVNGFAPEQRDTPPAQISSFLADPARIPMITAAETSTDVFPRMLAGAFAAAGKPEEAMHWLKLAAERGFINYPYLAQHDPFFESLRGRPQFQELLAIAHDRWQSFAA